MHDALRWPDLHARQEKFVKIGGIALQKFQCALREHDPEAESKAGLVLLEHLDLPVRVAALEEPGEEQSRRAGTGDEAALSHVYAKKANVRASMLWRGGAPAGVAGSTKEQCGVKRARPSFSES